MGPLSRGEEPGAPTGARKRGGSGLLWAKSLHRTGTYNIIFLQITLTFPVYHFLSVFDKVLQGVTEITL